LGVADHDDLVAALDALLGDLAAPPPAHAPPPAATPLELGASCTWCPPLQAVRGELKVGGADGGAEPTSLPGGLRAAVAAAAFPASLALHASVWPGCTLLSFEAFVPRGAGEAHAGAALAALLASGDGVGAYLGARESVSVSLGGVVATARFGALVAGAGAGAGAGAAAAQAASARLPRLAALAARTGAPAALAAAPGSEAALPPAASLRCRVHGRFLALTEQAPRRSGAPQLAACPEAGVALLEHAIAGADSAAAPAAASPPFAPRAAPRPLLLSDDAAVVAELNAWAAESPSAHAQWDAAEAAVTLLGGAARRDAPAEVLAAACGAALALTWHAAAALPLSRLAAAVAAAAPAALPGGGAACAGLLAAAVAAADVAAVRSVLAAGGPACALGAPAASLHAAASLADASAARAVCVELTRPDDGAAAGPAAGADAALAWLHRRDAHGFTPSQLAARHGDAALLSWDAALREEVAAALPAARAAAAAAAERYAAAHAPHLAHLACAAVADATDARDADAARRAALVGAMLRCAAGSAADSAEARHAAEAEARRPLARLRAALRPAVATAAAQEAEEEAAWRFRGFCGSIEVVCVFQAIYHVTQALRITNAPRLPLLHALPLLPAGTAALGVQLLRAERWGDNTTVVGARLLPVSLWFQVPATAALLAALATPRGRAALAAHLQPILAAQFIVHALACTMVQSAALHAELGDASVVLLFPYRVAATVALFTLFIALTWPLRPRWALPLLAVRGALPVATVLAPASRLGRLWPATGAAGARLQAAACVAAAAHTVWRERRLRDAFATQRAQNQQQHTKRKQA
jgi:hypothetical protein